jgi:UDP-N-acetylmuramoyl-L-alanyl-D-glutamate--2,6-diaminopimelate ligase
MLLRMDSRESWSPLIGQHNAYHLLAIYSTAVVLGTDEEEALIAMSSLRPAPGRLENMRGPKDISVIIDYAHTPDALENVLKTVRNIAPDRELICLFGCGGDRDRSKRAPMGRVAEELSDFVIVTSDNSRNENKRQIVRDILSGMQDVNRRRVILDRKRAIEHAIENAKKNDIIVLTGKGHELYQIENDEEYYFDERQIVIEAFKKRKEKN